MNKNSITISCLGYQLFSLFVYISLYLNIAPNLSALCCLIWQGPKPQWGAGRSFDYSNGTQFAPGEVVIFLGAIFSRGIWWDHIEPHTLLAVQHGRNYSGSALWSKNWGDLCLCAGVWYLELTRFWISATSYKQEKGDGQQCWHPTVSPSRSWHLYNQCNHFQGEIKLADKMCVFTVIKNMSHQMSVTRPLCQGFSTWSIHCLRAVCSREQIWMWLMSRLTWCQLWEGKITKELWPDIFSGGETRGRVCLFIHLKLDFYLGEVTLQPQKGDTDVVPAEVSRSQGVLVP